jgi:hypothetical protein
MGLGGARHRTLGVAAVSAVASNRAAAASCTRRPLRAIGLLTALAALAALGGCNTIGGFAGAAAAVSTGAVTANPAIGIGVGVAVQAGTDAGIKYATRKWQQAEQDAIAAEVGGMAVGETRPWAIKHSIPYGNEQGEVQVTEVIKTPLTDCKGMLFSVVAGKGDKQTRAWYASTACRQGNHWKWAVAEPAVPRWGNLQ